MLGITSTLICTALEIWLTKEFRIIGIIAAANALTTVAALA
jgi:hypothetical protein